MSPSDFYNSVCQDLSILVTRRYSTSFSLGIRMFDKKFRLAIYSLYGFVRWADEIVDSFNHLDRRMYFDRFKLELQDALNEKFSLHPILQSFVQTVSKNNISQTYIDSFMYSMEMDLSKTSYDSEEYQNYIYGSAEAVGLMCLQIFTGDEKEFERLKKYASLLGSAFQKVNFLRDIRSDYNYRGRMYFPQVEWETFDESAKKMIEQDIQGEFSEALIGIRQLPSGSGLGVYVAYLYYQALLNKIKSWPPQKLMTARCRISNFHKLFLLILAIIRFRFNKY
jgi:15-cis-phytoene synthase